MKRANRAPIFNLKAVVHETGIKPDTLRAWERRYGIPNPQRTESGHRLFTQRDIDILKWLLKGQEEGLSISRAVALWRKLEKEQGDPLESSTMTVAPRTDEPPPSSASEKPRRLAFSGLQNLHISRHDLESSSVGSGQGDRLVRLREQWIAALLGFDEQAADETLSTAFGLFTPEIVCIELIQKSLAAIGQGWYEGRVTVQQEHFASALAIRRLDSLLASTPPPTRPGRILVGCPPEEAHTFVPLMLSLLLRRKGWNVIYLGADIPIQSLELTINSTRPDLVILSAQQLHTVVGLLDMSKVLAENLIPLGFGGLIFNRLPQVQNLIPGYFLGNELRHAVQAVERIMAAPRPKGATQTVDAAHVAALDHFHERRARIEAEVWRSLDSGNLPQRQLSTGNSNFGRSIQAALALGDMNLLSQDMDWIRGLLHNHSRIPRYVLHEYMSAYRNAAHLHMDATGAPILKWLDNLDLSWEDEADENRASTPIPWDPNARTGHESTSTNANGSALNGKRENGTHSNGTAANGTLSNGTASNGAASDYPDPNNLQRN